MFYFFLSSGARDWSSKSWSSKNGMLNGLATRLKADDMALQGAVMAGFGLTVNLFSYLYQLAMGALLPPVQYGVLFTFTSLLVIVSVFSQSIAAAVARLTSQFRANG